MQRCIQQSWDGMGWDGTPPNGPVLRTLPWYGRRMHAGVHGEVASLPNQIHTACSQADECFHWDGKHVHYMNEPSAGTAQTMNACSTHMYACTDEVPTTRCFGLMLRTPRWTLGGSWGMLSIAKQRRMRACMRGTTPSCHGGLTDQIRDVLKTTLSRVCACRLLIMAVRERVSEWVIWQCRCHKHAADAAGAVRGGAGGGGGGAPCHGQRWGRGMSVCACACTAHSATTCPEP